MKKMLFSLINVIFLFTVSIALAEEVPTFSKNQTAQIQEIIHSYLVNNPKVLIEASRALQVQQRAEMIKHAEQAIKDNHATLFNDHKSFTGNASGNVTLVEFFDYKCLHCKRMASVVKDISDKDKNLKIIYKPLPIFGSVSSYAAKASLIAARQNKYQAFHQAMFELKSNFDTKQVIQAARKAGLDVKKLRKEIKDPKLDKVLEENITLAQKIGIAGTPAFIVAANTNNPDKLASFFIPGAARKPTLLAMISKARQSA